MPLESASDINGLNILWPLGGDVKGEGDNHLRMLKSVLKNSFPGLSGAIHRRVAKAANFAVVSTDNTVLFDCSGTLVATPAAAATLGSTHTWMFYVRSGTLQVDPNGAELIDGAASKVFVAGTWGIIFCDGTGLTSLTNASLPANTVFESTIADGSITYVKFSASLGTQILEVTEEANDLFVIVDGSDSSKLKKTIGGVIKQTAPGGGYTIGLADIGKQLRYTGSGGTYNIPLNSVTAFPIGATVTFVHTGSGTLVIAPASGVTIRFAGTNLSGTRNLSSPGLATALKVDTDTWFISGAGLS